MPVKFENSDGRSGGVGSTTTLPKQTFSAPEGWHPRRIVSSQQGVAIETLSQVAKPVEPQTIETPVTGH